MFSPNLPLCLRICLVPALDKTLKGRWHIVFVDMQGQLGHFSVHISVPRKEMVSVARKYTSAQKYALLLSQKYGSTLQWNKKYALLFWRYAACTEIMFFCQRNISPYICLVSASSVQRGRKRKSEDCLSWDAKRVASIAIKRYCSQHIAVNYSFWNPCGCAIRNMVHGYVALATIFVAFSLSWLGQDMQRCLALEAEHKCLTRPTSRSPLLKELKLFHILHLPPPVQVQIVQCGWNLKLCNQPKDCMGCIGGVDTIWALDRLQAVLLPPSSSPSSSFCLSWLHSGRWGVGIQTTTTSLPTSCNPIKSIPCKRSASCSEDTQQSMIFHWPLAACACHQTYKPKSTFWSITDPSIFISARAGQVSVQFMALGSR